MTWYNDRDDQNNPHPSAHERLPPQAPQSEGPPQWHPEQPPAPKLPPPPSSTVKQCRRYASTRVRALVAAGTTLIVLLLDWILVQFYFSSSLPVNFPLEARFESTPSHWPFAIVLALSAAALAIVAAHIPSNFNGRGGRAVWLGAIVAIVLVTLASNFTLRYNSFYSYTTVSFLTTDYEITSEADQASDDSKGECVPTSSTDGSMVPKDLYWLPDLGFDDFGAQVDVGQRDEGNNLKQQTHSRLKGQWTKSDSEKG